MQIRGYASRFEPLHYVLAFTQKDFHYVHQGPFTKGTSIEELHRLQIRSTQLQLSHLYTRGKAQSQAQRKERLQLGDHLDYKQELGDLKRPQTKHLSQYNILEDRF